MIQSDKEKDPENSDMSVDDFIRKVKADYLDGGTGSNRSRPLLRPPGKRAPKRNHRTKNDSSHEGLR
jgi:hypothetical protein